MIEHSEECLKQQADVMQAREDWERAYPNYCRQCQGAGVSVFYESHGFKFGPREMLTDPCICTEASKCARCGAASLTDEEAGDQTTGDGPCRFCGWNYDDALPQPIECWGVGCCLPYEDVSLHGFNE